MTFTNFIKRPVLSTVISIFFVLLGIIGITSLPIEQYPEDRKSTRLNSSH